MGKMIDKFKPPVIKPADLARGVRYLPDNPVQRDFLGNELSVGDLIVYGGTGDRSGNLIVGKVIGIYTRIFPPNEWQERQGIAARTETNIAVGLAEYGVRYPIKRQSTRAGAVMKISAESIFDKELLKHIVDA